MYFIKKFDQVTKRTEVLVETDSPEKAYELAHEFDALCNLKNDGDEEAVNEYVNPCLISIEDEDGNNVWDECGLARCPSVSNGLFQ